MINKNVKYKVFMKYCTFYSYFLNSQRYLPVTALPTGVQTVAPRLKAHTVHTLHTVHAVHTLHTVHTVHTVLTVHTVHTVHTVQSPVFILNSSKKITIFYEHPLTAKLPWGLIQSINFHDNLFIDVFYLRYLEIQHQLNMAEKVKENNENSTSTLS